MTSRTRLTMLAKSSVEQLWKRAHSDDRHGTTDGMCFAYEDVRVEGDADSVIEIWHDEGPIVMKAAVEAYQDVGFDWSIRTDHAPRMIGEKDRDEAMPGYTDMDRLFAIGFIKGLLE